MIYFITALVGWFAGDFIIGGLLFATFADKNSDPKSENNKIYPWIGKISGLVIALSIASSFN